MMQDLYFYQVSNIELLNDLPDRTVFQVFLRPCSAPMSYKAGQYIEIQYPDGSFQPFSIANAPLLDNTLELLIRLFKTEPLHQNFLNHLNKKPSLCLMGPFGNCTFEKLLHKPTLLLAGGIGFSQTKSIVEEMVRQQHTASIHLYWGFQHGQSVFLKTLLEIWHQQQANFQYTIIFEKNEPTHLSSTKIMGPKHFIPEIILKHYPHLQSYHVLVSGPKEMALSAKVLFKNGLPDNHLYSDWFNISNA